MRVVCVVSPYFCSALTGFTVRCIIATTSFHVVDQMGADTAAVSGNLYLQLVVENGVPSSPVLGAPLQHQ